MRSTTVLAGLVSVLLAGGAAAEAQDDPPRIGPVVLDLRGSLPSMPAESQLAESRGLDVRELPGRGFGGEAGLHVYLVRWKAVTVGLGGHVTVARARSAPAAATLRPVTVRFASMAPQLSLNFGTGNGWSYLSVGRGTSTWSVVPDGQAPDLQDRERLRTFNYGGGARWFSKPHLAFTFDVRFHEAAPGSPWEGRPGSPRTTLLVLAAGVSIK